MPGFIESQTGVTNSYSLSDPFYNLKEGLKLELTMPVNVENDSVAIAMAEKSFAGASGFPDYMFFSIDMLTNGASGLVDAGFFNNDWLL